MQVKLQDQISLLNADYLLVAPFYILKIMLLSLTLFTNCHHNITVNILACKTTVTKHYLIIILLFFTTKPSQYRRLSIIFLIYLLRNITIKRWTPFLCMHFRYSLYKFIWQSLAYALFLSYNVLSVLLITETEYVNSLFNLLPPKAYVGKYSRMSSPWVRLT